MAEPTVQVPASELRVGMTIRIWAQSLRIEYDDKIRRVQTRSLHRGSARKMVYIWLEDRGRTAWVVEPGRIFRVVPPVEQSVPESGTNP